MVKATYAGQTIGLEIDKQQEKTLIYIVAGIIVFIIAYSLYKSVSAVEAVTKPVSEGFKIVSDASIGTLKTVAALGTVPTVVANIALEQYSNTVKNVDIAQKLPTGSYDSYLNSLGVFGVAAKAGTTVLGDSVINTVIDAGQATRFIAENNPFYTIPTAIGNWFGSWV